LSSGGGLIAETANHQYGVTFPIAAKAVVKGPNAHPFYKWAADAAPKNVPSWNFHKYLVGRDGYMTEVFTRRSNPGIRGSKPRSPGHSRRPDGSRLAGVNRFDRQTGLAAQKALPWRRRSN
jgi:hypothetical protein